MNNGIILTINLPGRIKGSVSHTETQTVQVKEKGKYINVKILHSDREDQTCYQRTTISPEAIAFWQSNHCPSFVHPRDWKKMTKKQRVLAYVNSFDEGLGVSYEEL